MRYFWLCFFCLFSFCYASEQIPHECGVAVVRLRKPLAYYSAQYGDVAWGMNKLMTLMDKQRNRGQDGAGVAVVKFDIPSGQEYLHQVRAAGDDALDHLYDQIFKELHQIKEKTASAIKQNPYLGEAMLGHLRYATHSSCDFKFCQPFVHVDTVACKHFALAGNFNMTNTQSLFNQLHKWGLSLTTESDTHVILEMIAYYLDREYQNITQQAQEKEAISEQIDLARVLKKAATLWDGGYVFAGMLGNGDAFICRDPAGIRPGYYYLNDEVFAAASERVALMDAFDISEDKILPIKPGHVLVIKKSGEISETPFTSPLPEKQCSFERIYFSRASDPLIYQQRKALGKNLAARVYEAIGGDLEHAIFTYVPNSSICAFQGLVEEINRIARQSLLEEMLSKQKFDDEELEKLVQAQARTEYLVAKNQKMRTFISNDQKRDNLVAQLYGVTKGIVTPRDTLVVIDDSIVRGTTLKESLVRKLMSLKPKKIVIVSSAPPVMYPDCYGIDISQFGRFIAFQAAVSLLKERNEMHVLKEIEALCMKQNYLPPHKLTNEIKKLYDRFTLEEISHKVAELIKPADAKGVQIQVIYQTIDGLHKSMPGYDGDWYFTGEYPTPGGYQVLNTSYLNWCEHLDCRAY